MASITCSGSIALDTTRTPFKTVEMVLGGAAAYFSMAASFFAKVHAVSVVGADFPEEYWKLLEKSGISMEGVQKKPGKSFHYDCSYSFDLYQRTANKTDLNVLGEFEPLVPDGARKSEFVYLATMPPEKQLDVLRQVGGRKLAFMDTIEFYIHGSRDPLLKTMAEVDGVILNDAEARMLAGEANLVKCGRKIAKLGPSIAIIKKGEHGALLFHDGEVVPFPAFPLEELLDPNGAGDAFAGGFVGALAERGAVSPKMADLKVAMAYANVMGSIAVEDFSVDRIVRTSREEINRRFSAYVELMRIH